ncbi:OmpW family outer membrane protein [Psychrobacter sp. HD31]|uniref:OmpW/AlkL family protein n=1 Tax=Psychrobacter sp. HD31 TaxID=3112003 RepID=UPI003DA6AECE
MMKLKTLLVATATAFTMASAFAAPAGTWSLGVGAGYVMPDSDNGSVLDGALEVDVDGDVRPTITAEYFVADNFGIELLAATPFKHDISLSDADGNVIDARTKHLPPTLSLQYHFDGADMPVKPFIGVGVNYTTFFDERIYLANGNDLDLDDSVGVAGHVGVDIPFSASEAVRVDARYIDLESDVKLNDQDIGTAEINPWVFGVSYVKNF